MHSRVVQLLFNVFCQINTNQWTTYMTDHRGQTNFVENLNTGIYIERSYAQRQQWQ
uniref:Uncharacterized protein n=1 Tax=Zea mays TaxID=4577 RepID=C4J8J0_MAIZE|nr:unknown [Zea mays]